MIYRFDRFELDPEIHELVDRELDRKINLRPQAFNVLVYLLERAPALAGREELLTGVWGHTALSPSGVSQAIREIRKALKDDASDPKILGTRHGCGYQILVPVERGQRLADETPRRPPEPDPKPLAPSHYIECQVPAEVSRQPLVTAGVAGILPLAGLIIALVLTRDEPGSMDPSKDAVRSGDSVTHSDVRPAEDPVALPAGARDARSRMLRVASVEQFAAHWRDNRGSVHALLALINAYVDAGYLGRARQLIGHPLLERAPLDHRSRLEVYATMSRVGGRWKQAGDALRSLVDFFPDEQQYKTWLFEARLKSGPLDHADEALRKYAEAQTFSDSDPRHLIALSELELRRGNREQASSMADAAIAGASEPGSEALRAFALLARARAAEPEQVDKIRSMYEEAGAVFRELHDYAALSLVLAGLADSALKRRRPDEADELVNELCTLGGDRDIPLARGNCQMLRGRMHAMNGQFDQAIDRLTEALDVFGELGERKTASRVLVGLGDAYHRAGDSERALIVLEDAVRGFEAVGSRRGLASAHLVRGNVFARLGRLDGAVESFEQAQNHFEALGNSPALATALTNLAAALQSQGRVQRAAELNLRAAGIFERLGDVRSMARMEYNRGLSLHRIGDLDGALEALEIAIRRFAEIGAPEARVAALTAMARIHLDQVEFEAARDALKTAAGIDAENPLRKASLETARAELAIIETDFAQAEQRIRTARELRQEAGSAAWVRQSDLDLARLHLERGQYQKAESLARSVLDELGPDGGLDERVRATVTLARSLADRRLLAEARWELENVVLLDLNQLDKKAELELRQQRARLYDGPSQIEQLHMVRDHALDMGFRLLALETDAQLAIEMMLLNFGEEGVRMAEAVIQNASDVGALCVADYVWRIKRTHQIVE